MKRILLLLLLAAGALDATELEVLFTAENPQIDGRCDDPAWQDAPWHELIRLGDGTPPQRPGRFKIRYGMDDFFLFVVCDEPAPEQLLQRQNDLGSLWEDDSLELFFANGDGPTDQLIVNAAGKRANRRNSNIERGEDHTLLWAWEAATQIGAAEWSAEVRIPYAVLALNDSFLDALRFNLGRNAQNPRSELSTFAPLASGSFHDQEHFARLRLLPAPGAESIPARYAANQVALRRGNALSRLLDVARRTRSGDDFHRDLLTRNAAGFARLEWLHSRPELPPAERAELTALTAALLLQLEQYDAEVAAKITEELFTPAYRF